MIRATINSWVLVPPGAADGHVVAAIIIVATLCGVLASYLATDH